MSKIDRRTVTGNDRQSLRSSFDRPLDHRRGVKFGRSPTEGPDVDSPVKRKKRRKSRFFQADHAVYVWIWLILQSRLPSVPPEKKPDWEAMDVWGKKRRSAFQAVN